MSLNDLPRCARDCFVDAATTLLDCSSLAPSCLCTAEAQGKLQVDFDFIGCLTSECSAAELAAAVDWNEDFCRGRTVTTRTSSTTTTRTTRDSVPSRTSPARVSRPSSSGSLSTGAKAGIIVGAIIFAALFAALVKFLLLRRRRLKDSASAHGVPDDKPTTDEKATGVPELEGKAVYPELDPHPSNVPDFVELDTGPYVPPDTTAELRAEDGTSRAYQCSGVPGAIIASDSTGGRQQGGSPTSAELPTEERAVELQQTEAQHANTPRETTRSNDGLPAEPSSSAANVPALSGPEPTAEELDQLLALEDELNARRTTLEQLKEVQEQQAMVRDRILKIKAQREAQGGA